MAASTSRRAYADCFELMDAALQDEHGIRIKCADNSAIHQLRSRLHYARTIDRDENKIIHPEEDHPMHGRSVYDELRTEIKNLADGLFLYLRKVSVKQYTFESLSEIGEEIVVPTQPVAEMIPHVFESIKRRE